MSGFNIMKSDCQIPVSVRNTRRGALTVEVAICLPILLMFLFACYEIAHANMLLHATESAAYEAARVGIVPGARRDKIESAAAAILNTVGIQDFSIKLTPNVITPDTPKVKVEVAVPFRRNTVSPQFFIKDPTFRGQCELTREVL